jgi:dihydroorotate dehydrogenase electron transfer subunit
MPYFAPTVVQRRELGALTLLTMQAPELARAARPGQAVFLRCAAPGSADPLLRRPLFLAGADGAAGTVELMVAGDERDAAWLAAQPVGARLDLYGPVGGGFAIDGRTRNLLLAGAGIALPALIALCRVATARGLGVVLLAAAPASHLPPPFILPPDVEYQSSDEGEQGLAALLAGAIGWADQLCLALDDGLVATVSAAVRAGKLRWERGFAQAILAGPMPCGLGICQACAVETRDGQRLRCKDGPIFDLRDLRQ